MRALYEYAHAVFFGLPQRLPPSVSINARLFTCRTCHHIASSSSFPSHPAKRLTRAISAPLVCATPRRLVSVKTCRVRFLLCQLSTQSRKGPPRNNLLRKPRTSGLCFTTARRSTTLGGAGPQGTALPRPRRSTLCRARVGERGELHALTRHARAIRCLTTGICNGITCHSIIREHARPSDSRRRCGGTLWGHPRGRAAYCNATINPNVSGIKVEGRGGLLGRWYNVCRL